MEYLQSTEATMLKALIPAAISVAGGVYWLLRRRKRKVVFDSSEWEAAESFDDLVNLNIRFIKGELTSTPRSCGPLYDDVNAVSKDLLDLCCDALVLTIDSQSRCYESEYDIRQRGYVEGMWKGDFDDFVKKLRATSLEFVAIQGDKMFKLMRLHDGRWPVTKSSKKCHTGLWDCDLTSSDLKIELEKYDTDAYSFSEDPSLVWFDVVEPTWPEDGYVGNGGDIYKVLRAALADFYELQQ
jgi:hypothetical protein